MKKKLILIPILVLALVVSLVLPVAGCADGELTLTPEMEEFIEEQLAGLKGEQGETGTAGPAGKQGPTGEQGEPGSQGVMGKTGPEGATGSTGAKGEQGIQGEDGERGSTGATGSKGATGTTGSAGDVLLLSVIDRAAFRLLATQNADGGWEWLNPDTDPNTLTTSGNTVGVTAQGILDCYKIFSLPRFYNACILAYSLTVANSISTDPYYYRIRGPDIPFLVELSEVTGTPEYANIAKTRYDAAVIEFGSLAVYVRDVRINQGYPGLISWDVNLYVQGALALDRYFSGQDYDVQADAMAEVTFNSLYAAVSDYDPTKPAQNYYCLAVSGALETFATTGTHLEKIAELTTSLLGQQQPDGSFLGGTDGELIQPTAYAIMALNEIPDCDRFMVSAVNFLIGTQEMNGCWIDDETECNEVTSEVAQAIYDFIK